MWVNDYISKPINWTALPYKIKHIILANQAVAEKLKSDELVAKLGRVLNSLSNEIYAIDCESLKLPGSAAT